MHILFFVQRFLPAKKQNSTVYPVDKVKGYTTVQLQNALVGSKSWNDWRDKIKNNYNNPTEIYVDELFNNWQCKLPIFSTLQK